MEQTMQRGQVMQQQMYRQDRFPRSQHSAALLTSPSGLFRQERSRLLTGSITQDPFVC